MIAPTHVDTGPAWLSGTAMSASDAPNCPCGRRSPVAGLPLHANRSSLRSALQRPASRIRVIRNGLLRLNVMSSRSWVISSELCNVCFGDRLLRFADFAHAVDQPGCEGGGYHAQQCETSPIIGPIPTSRPPVVTGTSPPYPTVETVTNDHQTASREEQKEQDRSGAADVHRSLVSRQ